MMDKQKLSAVISHATVGITTLIFASLHCGWLKMFFFDAEHSEVQGVDYFSAPKSFLNLLEHRSMYDSWQGIPYGAYLTWYLAHPAYSVLIASWFSFFSPWTSYYLFTFFSLGLLVGAGYLISRLATESLNKSLAYFLMLCGFPAYWLLFVGNIHAILLLALTLIFISIFELAYADCGLQHKKITWKLLIGLLMSLLSKPIVLLMLPVLLLAKETRKTTLISLAVYVAVSALFIAVPLLNPQGIGLKRLLEVAFDVDFIKKNMNIYENHFILNEYMRDNSIHWLNLIAQSDYRFMHIDVFSLPVFVDTIVGERLPEYIYKLPIYITLILSVAIGFIPDRKNRLESMLLLLMTISLTFFLSYNIVWEYQYTSTYPLVALLPILKEKNVFYARYIPWMLMVGCFFYLPSLYFLVRKEEVTTSVLTIIRADRVVPAAVLFLLMLYCNVKNISAMIKARYFTGPVTGAA